VPAPFLDRLTDAQVQRRRRARQTAGVRRTPLAHRQPPGAVGPHLPGSAAHAAVAAAAAAAGAFVWGDFGLRRGPSARAGGAAGGDVSVGPPAAAVVGMAADGDRSAGQDGVRWTRRKHALVLFPMPGDATLSLTVAVAQSARAAGKWGGDVYAAVSRRRGEGR
jgi:hypothetical protein